MNVALYDSDIGRANRGNVLYLQPGGGNIGDFVQARVNSAIEASDYLTARVRPDRSTKQADKVGLKRFGRGYTYWRTAGSRTGLRGVDAGVRLLRTGRPDRRRWGHPNSS